MYPAGPKKSFTYEVTCDNKKADTSIAWYFKATRWHSLNFSTQKSILQLCAWLPSLWTGVRLRVTLLWYKHCCFSNTNYFVIMLTRYWSPSRHFELALRNTLALRIKGLATKYTTVKWLIDQLPLIFQTLQ